MATKELELQLTGRDAGAGAVLRETEGGIRRVGSAADEASAKTGGLLQKLKQMQKEQRASGEKSLEGLLKGGGVAAMATLVMAQAQKMTGAMHAAVSDAITSGESSGEAFWQGMGAAFEEIPILGQAAQIGTELAKTIQDAEALEWKNNGASNWLDMASDDTKVKINEQRQQLESSAQQMYEGFHRAGLDANKRGYDLQVAQIESGYHAEMQKIREMAAQKRALYTNVEAEAFTDEATDRLNSTTQAQYDRAGDDERLRREDVDRGVTSQTRSGEASMLADTLNQNGQTAAAATVILKAQYAERYDQMQAAYQAEMKLAGDDFARKTKLSVEYFKAAYALADESHQKIADAERKQKNEEADAEYRGEKSVADANHRAMMERLQSHKTDLASLKQADLEEAKFRRDEAIKAIEQEQKVSDRNSSSEEKARHQREADAKKAAAEADFQAKGQKAHEADIERKNSLAEKSEQRAATFEKLEVESLQFAAKNGNGQAKLEGERVEIAGKYAEKQAQIAKILRDQSSTAAEKKAAEQAQSDLRKQETMELSLVGAENENPTAAAALQEGFGLTGVAQGAQTRANRRWNLDKQSRLANTSGADAWLSKREGGKDSSARIEAASVGTHATLTQILTLLSQHLTPPTQTQSVYGT